MLNSKKVLKRIGGVALSAAVVLSSVSALAAGNITWQVKDYITTTGFSGTVGNTLGTGHGGPVLAPAYEIVYEQYLDGVSTGLVISGTEAEQYGLKAYASSITRPVTWYDTSWPNLQYEEIWADGQYTGLVWPTGAQLPLTSYKDVRFMWEVGGTHKEVSRTHAYLNGAWYTDGTYPTQYTGSNANVIEENRYFGFDVFEVFEDGKARDVEVVLDKRGNAVNTIRPTKALYMEDAANNNTIYNGSITPLVNSGNGVESVLYNILDGMTPASIYENVGLDGEVPAYDFTGYPADFFDYKLPITYYLHLSGPTYDTDGNVVDPYGNQINAYEDCVIAGALNDSNTEIDTNGDFVNDDVDMNGTGDWDFEVDSTRFSFYTNNLISSRTVANNPAIDTKHALHATSQVTAVTDWVYAGWELVEPYRMYEYLSIEGIVFDGDIDDDGQVDTPVLFRYMTAGTANIVNPVGDANSTSGLFNPSTVSYALADPKVEWRYAFVEAAYPHEIYSQKWVENMNGVMIPTDEIRGTEKYAKENAVAVINPTDGVESLAKHYQMRLEWRDNETRTLYVAPYDINMHAAEYLELSASPDPDYIGAIDYTVPGADVNLVPSIASVN